MKILTEPDLRTRPSKTAQEFMKRKGYELRPIHFEKIVDQEVWYYYYDLDEGLLELEVELDQQDVAGLARVTAFVMGSHEELLTNN